MRRAEKKPHLIRIFTAAEADLKDFYNLCDRAPDRKIMQKRAKMLNRFHAIIITP